MKLPLCDIVQIILLSVVVYLSKEISAVSLFNGSTPLTQNVSQKNTFSSLLETWNYIQKVQKGGEMYTVYLDNGINTIDTNITLSAVGIAGVTIRHIGEEDSVISGKNMDILSWNSYHLVTFENIKINLATTTFENLAVTFTNTTFEGLFQMSSTNSTIVLNNTNCINGTKQFEAGVHCFLTFDKLGFFTSNLDQSTIIFYYWYQINGSFCLLGYSSDVYMNNSLFTGLFMETRMFEIFDAENVVILNTVLGKSISNADIVMYVLGVYTDVTLYNFTLSENTMQVVLLFNLTQSTNLTLCSEQDGIYNYGDQFRYYFENNNFIYVNQVLFKNISSVYSLFSIMSCAYYVNSVEFDEISTLSSRAFMLIQFIYPPYGEAYNIYIHRIVNVLGSIDSEILYILCRYANMILQNVLIEESRALDSSFQTAGILIYFATVDVKNATLQDSTLGILYSFWSTITINLFRVLNHTTSTLNPTFIVYNTIMTTMNNLFLNNVTLASPYPIFRLDSLHCNFSNSVFQNLNSISTGFYLMEIFSTILGLDNCSFQDIQMNGNFLFYISQTSITLYDCIIQDINAFSLIEFLSQSDCSFSSINCIYENNNYSNSVQIIVSGLIQNTTFINCCIVSERLLVISPEQGTFLLDQTKFINNNGGALQISPISLAKITITSTLFYGNVASRGAAILVETLNFNILSIQNCSFINQTGLRYGDTFTSANGSVIWKIFSGQIVNLDKSSFIPTMVYTESGNTLLPFSLTLQDLFGQVMKSSSLQDGAFAVELKIETKDLHRNAVLVNLDEKIMFGEEVELVFNETIIIGTPGNYSLIFQPLLGFRNLALEANVTLLQCTQPNVLHTYGSEEYPRCVKPTCSLGCNEPFGQCIDIEECLCREGFDGLQCQLRTDSRFDEVTIFLNSTRGILVSSIQQIIEVSAINCQLQLVRVQNIGSNNTLEIIFRVEPLSNVMPFTEDEMWKAIHKSIQEKLFDYTVTTILFSPVDPIFPNMKLATFSPSLIFLIVFILLEAVLLYIRRSVIYKYQNREKYFVIIIIFCSILSVLDIIVSAGIPNPAVCLFSRFISIIISDTLNSNVVVNAFYCYKFGDLIEMANSNFRRYYQLLCCLLFMIGDLVFIVSGVNNINIIQVFGEAKYWSCISCSVDFSYLTLNLVHVIVVLLGGFVLHTFRGDVSYWTLYRNTVPLLLTLNTVPILNAIAIASPYIWFNIISPVRFIAIFGSLVLLSMLHEEKDDLKELSEPKTMVYPSSFQTDKSEVFLGLTIHAAQFKQIIQWKKQWLLIDQTNHTFLLVDSSKEDFVSRHFLAESITQSEENILLITTTKKAKWLFTCENIPSFIGYFQNHLVKDEAKILKPEDHLK